MWWYMDIAEILMHTGYWFGIILELYIFVVNDDRWSLIYAHFQWCSVFFTGYFVLWHMRRFLFQYLPVPVLLARKQRSCCVAIFRWIFWNFFRMNRLQGGKGVIEIRPSFISLPKTCCGFVIYSEYQMDFAIIYRFCELCWVRCKDDQRKKTAGKQTWVVVSNMFYFHPYLGNISDLTHIFQMGWNHQPEMLQTPPQFSKSCPTKKFHQPEGLRFRESWPFWLKKKTDLRSWTSTFALGYPDNTPEKLTFPFRPLKIKPVGVEVFCFAYFWGVHFLLKNLKEWIFLPKMIWGSGVKRTRK